MPVSWLTPLPDPERRRSRRRDAVDDSGVRVAQAWLPSLEGRTATLMSHFDRNCDDCSRPGGLSSMTFLAPPEAVRALACSWTAIHCRARSCTLWVRSAIRLPE